MVRNVYPFDDSDFIANATCLNFANTVGWHASNEPEEHLSHYADLVQWSLVGELIDHEAAERLRALAAERPSDAKRVLARAVALREALYRIFAELAAGRPPANGDLALLNMEFDRAPARLHVDAHADSFAVEWRMVSPTLDGLLGPILWSAGLLLEQEQLKWVKQCEAERCGWLFLDTSRNHSRRWCEMSGCGSRAKAKRYYYRHKE